METVTVSRRIKSSPVLPHTSGGGNTFSLNSLPLNDPFRRNSAADAASLLPTPGHIPSPMRRAGAAVRSGSLSTHLCCQRKAAPDCLRFPCIRRPHNAIPGHFPGPGKARGSPSLRFFSGRFQKKKNPKEGARLRRRRCFPPHPLRNFRAKPPERSGMRQPLRIFFGTKTTVAVPSPMAKTPPKRQEGSILRSAPFPRGAAFSQGKVPAGISRWGRPGRRRGENTGEEEG